MAVRRAIGLGMLRRSKDIGIDFAYPTQVAIHAGADGRAVAPLRGVTAPPLP